MMRWILVASLLAGTLPVSAQIAPRKQVLGELPKAVPTTSPLLAPKSRVVIKGVPYWAITLPRWPNGWGGANMPASDRRNYAMSAARARATISAPCEVSEYDRVDLSAARRRGFRLVGYSAESKLSAPASRENPVLEAVALDAAGNVTMDLPAATTIRVRAPIVAETTPYKQQSCKSYYALSITLEGPQGTQPFPPARPGSN